MEKKLTDEEIVKALVHCYVKRGRCDDCVLYEDDEKCLAPIAVLDLIQRQTAEIERLTEERDKYKEKWQTAYINELNLQKQVDELTEINIEERDIHFKIICGYKDEIARLEQAVKDTAKEICEMINRTCISSKGYLCSIILKRYGVEVE